MARPNPLLGLIPVGFLVAAALFVNPSSADSVEIPVELELVLSADSSSSIQGNEFDLQIHGYANAFRDSGVIDAISELGGNGIAVVFVQWSASFQQIETVSWSHVRSRTEAEAFANRIETQSRKFTGFGTATGSALEHAAGLFRGNGYAGRRRVIDMSSDEHSNHGPHPRHKREAVIAAGITINGLVVLDDNDDLEHYFQDNVIGGPGAFVMAVESYEDFAHAIEQKLIREITTPVAVLAPASDVPSKLASRSR